MTTPTTISLEVLAEKLHGKLWIKGDMKRIYLDEGYNTKKMSTKTYVYQREDGSYGVSCHIDCPSQAYQWIESQQNEIIEKISEKIEVIIFEANNPGVDFYEKKEAEAEKKELAEGQQFFLLNIEKLKKGWLDTYTTSINDIAEYDSAVTLYQNSSQDTKAKITSLEEEAKSILGTPGSKKRRIAIERELSKLPHMPYGPDYAYGPGGWKRIAASFKTAEEYLSFKENEERKKIELNAN